MLQLLTPTGGRPAAWALAQRWAAAQTYQGPVRWIVVDDVDPGQGFPAELPAGWTVDLLRPEPRWTGTNTQVRNLLAGLEVVDPAAPVVCWEDDEWYGPTWLDTVAEALDDDVHLVGQAPQVYYHVGSRRWRDMGNHAHASLSATALQGPAVDALRTACQSAVGLRVPSTRVFVDVHLWRTYAGPKRLMPWGGVVGIKGLPGRPGYGKSHRPSWKGTDDPDGAYLRQLLGADADAYRPFAEAVAA